MAKSKTKPQTKCLYIAGPMTGIPQFNFPLFFAVADALRADGWTIISPAETDPEEVRQAALASPDGKLDAAGKVGTETWGDCLARDVKQLADGIPQDDNSMLRIDGIALLPNWETSRGARLEAFTGMLTGKDYFTVEAHRHGPTQDIDYMLARQSVEWVQHRLALAWADGIRMHTPL